MSGAVDSQAAIAAAGGTVETLGGPVTVELEGDSLVVGGATVVTADVQASNGVVHVIDAVITETAAGTPSSVEAGNSGLAATNGTNGLLLAVLAGVAAMGIAGSALTLQRARRRD